MELIDEAFNVSDFRHFRLSDVSFWNFGIFNERGHMSGWDLFESSSSSDEESDENEIVEKVDQMEGTSIPLWQKHFPAFLGPIRFDRSDKVGGCREFVASRDIPAGTLLLCEEPFVKNIDESLPLDIRGCVAILRLAEEKRTSDMRESPVLLCAKQLHPVSLTCLDKRLVQTVRMKYKEHIDRLSKEYDVESDEILRLAFAVRCNKYSSGLFLHASIFNHSCRPNCVKFQPSKFNSKSEIWTTRSVSKGESFTISYLHPAEQHRALRRKRLRHQFLFTCECERCCEFKDEENTEREEEGGFHASLEQCLEEIENSDEKGIEKRLDYVVRALKDSLRLDADDEDTASLLARALRGRIEIRASELQKKDTSSLLKNHIARNFLLDCMYLEKVQIRLGLKDHPDYGRTKCDIASTIEALLENEKDRVPPEFSSRKEAYKTMKNCRLEYIRIREMYSK